MSSALFSLLIGVTELALALVYFHKVFPPMLAEARWLAIKIWMLAVALGLFGADRLEAAMHGADTALLYDLGHCALIIHASLRLYQIVKSAGRDDALTHT